MRIIFLLISILFLSNVTFCSYCFAQEAVLRVPFLLQSAQSEKRIQNIAKIIEDVQAAARHLLKTGVLGHYEMPIIIYGSVADGEERENSDLDLSISVPSLLLDKSDPHFDDGIYEELKIKQDAVKAELISRGYKVDYVNIFNEENISRRKRTGEFFQWQKNIILVFEDKFEIKRLEGRDAPRIEEILKQASIEFIDVLDANTGKPTGERVERDIAHKNALWHRVAHVIVFTRDGKVLVQYRGENIKATGGKKDISAGGHVSAGQESWEAAVRELKEELTISIKLYQLNEIGHDFRKKAVAENTAGYYDEKGIFIYHSDRSLNNEYASLYWIVTDKSVDEINKAIKEQREQSAEDSMKEVSYVEAVEFENLVRYIKDPVINQGYASGFKQYLTTERTKRILQRVSSDLKESLKNVKFDPINKIPNPALCYGL